MVVGAALGDAEGDAEADGDADALAEGTGLLELGAAALCELWPQAAATIAAEVTTSARRVRFIRPTLTSTNLHT